MNSSLAIPLRTSRHRTATLRALIGAFVAMLLVGLVPGKATAHAGDESYLYLEISEQVVADMQFPFADVNEHLGLDFDGDDENLDAAMQAASAELTAYARAHFSIESNGSAWVIGDSEVRRFQDTDYVSVRFDVRMEPENVPNDLTVTLDPFFDENPDRGALFLIFNDWDRGFVSNEADPLGRFTPDDRTQTIDIGDRSWTKNFTTSVELGLDHIKTGPDHILFVAVLLLPSVLVFARGWRPTDSFTRSLWRVLKVVSMFTVAHSITFTLAGIGFIPLPSARIVETIIALSIAAAALHNLHPIAPQREWLIAFSFGLFHGLGFASLVEELQVSQATKLVSLLGRNLGIEVGQAFVVLVVFPGLFMLSRTRFYMPFFKYFSWILMLVSLGWVTERLFDAPQATSKVVNFIVAWPRVMLLVAIFTAVAAALWRQAAANGQLVAVGTATADTANAEPVLETADA